MSSIFDPSRFESHLLRNAVGLIYLKSKAKLLSVDDWPKHHHKFGTV